MAELLRVDIESISSSESRSSFSEADLDLIADRILESGGIIKPLVLKKTGFEKYDVVDGHLEYYAAVRASEKNPHAAEVNALIISPESEEAVVRQVEALKSVQPTETDEHGISASTDIEFRVKTELQLKNLASEIQQLKTELTQEKHKLQKLEEKHKEVNNPMLKKIEPLEAFNNLNLVDLTFRLRSTGLTDTTAAKIAESVEQERKKKAFGSLTDVVARVKVNSGKKQVKGISGDKMVAIIDSWSRISFD